ncbi:MAG: hypothetical protein HYR85_08640 [Planctomycetes bacterium]|nr:hypothetical protein [Planctomycetota bacterium]MBI3846907.1 hypothetical protein [Planctomycetota bacterium]
MHERIVASRGHRLDSDTLSQILGCILSRRCRFRILEFRVGRTNEELSMARVDMKAINAIRSLGGSPRRFAKADFVAESPTRASSGGCRSSPRGAFATTAPCRKP